MQDQITQLQQQVSDLQTQVSSITQSSNIDRDSETALRERLSTDNGILKGIMIWGIGTMSGGKLDITHPLIKPTSTGIAIRANASATAGGFAQLAAGIPTAPLTMRFFEGSFSATWDVYYLVIF